MGNSTNNMAMSEIPFLDQSTGIYNQFFFFESGKQMIQLAKRNKVPLSICIMDVDNLKTINDTYSYKHGNAILKSIAEIIKNEYRTSDFVAHLNGGEFGFVFYNTSGVDTNIMLDTIRKRIEHHSYVFEQKKVNVTVSIGAAIMHSLMNTITLDVIYDQAYIAMNSAKGKGKNCVVIY